MNVLITGCFGFIGYNFLKYLERNFNGEFNIVGIDSVITKTSKLNKIEFENSDNAPISYSRPPFGDI